MYIYICMCIYMFMQVPRVDAAGGAPADWEVCFRRIDPNPSTLNP